jgi:hypothetical protein
MEQEIFADSVIEIPMYHLMQLRTECLWPTDLYS